MPSQRLKPHGPPETKITGSEYRLAVGRHVYDTGNPTDIAVQLHRMGDEASLDLIQIVANTPLTTAQIEKVLQFVQLAFGMTNQLLDRANLQPKSTVVLLQYLTSTTEDEETLAAIATTKQLVLTAASAPIGH